MSDDTPNIQERTVFAGRLAMALVQAAVLYGLKRAAEAPRIWPATDDRLFFPLILIAVFVPLIVLFGLRQMRLRPLAVWAGAAAAVIAGLGWHAATRGTAKPAFEYGWSPMPPTPLWLALAAMVFIGHALVVDSTLERRLMPSYRRHFDTAWGQGAQLSLAIMFIGIFWAVLLLGAGLFKLVGIEYFSMVIRQDWFSYPAITLALAVSLHVTDRHPKLIAARSVRLTQLAWLTPLLVLIVGGFLASLPFVSLKPLWRTGFATSLLLTAVAISVFLINACYGNGSDESTDSTVKRVSASVGALTLVPLVGLAAWALALRVGQYGWTVERIFAAAIMVVAGIYAIGYAVAVFDRTRWLRRLEVTNVVNAYVLLLLGLVLFSPAADPGRLMVASQMGRLASGAISPEKFDYVALKFDGARWGMAALEKLRATAEGSDAATIRQRVEQALAATSRSAGAVRESRDDDHPLDVAVFPADRTLPLEILDTKDWPSLSLCNGPKRCFARYVSLGEKRDEGILFFTPASTAVFEKDASGRWRRTGQVLGGSVYCASVRDSLEKGDFQTSPAKFPDLVVNGQRIAITSTDWTCPQAGKR